MLEQLILLQERFQLHLLNGDYTFIGPTDERLLEPFMARSNDVAPGNLFDNSWHRVLSNNAVTRQALNIFPANTPLRIYVITRGDDAFLIHGTIEEYCQDHNIHFQQ